MAICRASSVITQEACVDSNVLLSIQDNYGNIEATNVPHPSCIGIELKSVEKNKYNILWGGASPTCSESFCAPTVNM